MYAPLSRTRSEHVANGLRGHANKTCLPLTPAIKTQEPFMIVK